METTDLRQLLVAFEVGRLSEIELVESLADCCELNRERCGENAASREFLARLEEFARRVEMIEFNVCAAERRGAILEVVADFRASVQI